MTPTTPADLGLFRDDEEAQTACPAPLSAMNAVPLPPHHSDEDNLALNASPSRPYSDLVVTRTPPDAPWPEQNLLAHVSFTVGPVRIHGVKVYRTNPLTLNFPERPVNGKWTNVVVMDRALRDLLTADVARELEGGEGA